MTKTFTGRHMAAIMVAFFGVMGLPIRLVLQLLEEVGEKYEFGRAMDAEETVPQA